LSSENRSCGNNGGGCAYEVSVLKELVEVNTDVTRKTGYADCARLIAQRMEALGLAVEVFDSAERAGDGRSRPNVVGTLDVGAGETLGLITHYDVVPPGEGWSRDPFRLTIEGDKAYGRGAADDKSAIAASLGAIRMVLAKGKAGASFNVKVVASPEEEIGGQLGIGYMMRDVGLDLDCGVIVDAPPHVVSIGASGILQGTIRVVGKQGHAGYPHMADNPIPKLALLISAFEEFRKRREAKVSQIDAPPDSPKKKLWGRLSFTIVGGGEKENVIPGEAWAKFDMRLIPDEEASTARSEMIDFFEEARARFGINATLSFDKFDSGYLTDPSKPFVVRFVKAAAAVFGSPLPIAASLGGDDGKYLSERGIPVISYGAIADDTNFHGVDEFVRLSDIRKLRDVLVRLIE